MAKYSAFSPILLQNGAFVPVYRDISVISFLWHGENLQSLISRLPVENMRKLCWCDYVEVVGGGEGSQSYRLEPL
jgi:hypothetical protein